MKTKSLRLGLALLMLCAAGSSFAAKKVERTTNIPKPGSGCSTQEQACLSGAGAGCSTQDCKDKKIDACTKAYNDCVSKNPSPK